jgi:hypothetical protein
MCANYEPICFSDLRPSNQQTRDLFSLVEEDERRNRLIESIEAVCDKFGKTAVTIGTVENKNDIWAMKQEWRSPNYLTCLDEIPLVN